MIDAQVFRTTGLLAADPITRALRVAEKLTLLGLARVGVDATAGGQSLEQLLGSALHDRLKRLTLLPAASGIFWALGAADSSGPWLPAGGVELPCEKDEADQLRFITASGTVDLMVVEEG